MITAPPVPINEIERLADLQALKILDTPPEERFDRIVALAAATFDVPIAYIALVDSDRQWFKATHGLEISETKREISFCGHTILQKEPLIIPDATQDERFRDNPLVLGEPYTRFYAGFPLAGPKGHNVGTLCLASPNPRTLTAHELNIFQKIGELTEQTLNAFDLISSQHQLLETRNQLLSTQQQLAFELDQADQYIRSLLPKKLEGSIQTDWRFISSSQLGGDGFGYHWLDTQHLAIYLFDVSGHGVGAALLSATLLKAIPYLSSSTRDPGDILHSLNEAFPMQENGGRFITCWYGLYNTESRELKF
jgi:phosphoserine phosphatase RsbU/P